MFSTVFGSNRGATSLFEVPENILREGRIKTANAKWCTNTNLKQSAFQIPRRARPDAMKPQKRGVAESRTQQAAQEVMRRSEESSDG